MQKTQNVIAVAKAAPLRPYKGIIQTLVSTSKANIQMLKTRYFE